MFEKLKSGHWPIFMLSSISSIGNLFLPIILVRLLSTEDMGIYKIFFLHFSAIPFLVLAGGPVHSVFYWVGKNQEEKEKSLNATLVLSLLLSALVLIIGFPFRVYISEHFDVPLKYVSILLLTGFLSAPAGHFAEATIALGKSALGSIIDTIFELFKAGGIIFVAWKYRNLEALFYYFGFILLLKFVLTNLLNRKINHITFKTDVAHIKKVLSYCFPISLSGCLGFFVDKIDLLILSSFLDNSSFAFYSMGCLVVPPLYLLEMSVQKVLIPSLSKAYVARDWNGAAESYRKAIRDVAFLIIPSIFGLMVFASPIVRMLYTDQYLDSVPYLQLFALTYLLLMLPHDSVARATGRTKWVLKIYLLVTPISLISALLAAKYSSAKVVLIVTILIKFIPKFLGLKLSKDLMNWDWKQMFPIKQLSLYTAICAGLSVICLLARNFFEKDINWFLTCGSGFAIIYLGTVYLLMKKGRHA